MRPGTVYNIGSEPLVGVPGGLIESGGRRHIDDLDAIGDLGRYAYLKADGTTPARRARRGSASADETPAAAGDVDTTPAPDAEPGAE